MRVEPVLSPPSIQTDVLQFSCYGSAFRATIGFDDGTQPSRGPLMRYSTSGYRLLIRPQQHQPILDHLNMGVTTRTLLAARQAGFFHRQ